MNVIEKILARQAGQNSVAPGDLVVVDVGTALVPDIVFQVWGNRVPASLHDPDRVVVVADHLSLAVDVRAAETLNQMRRFVRHFGIERFHDVGRENGIEHQIVAERAYALPGTVLLGGDSHTCAGGVLNCCARGVGIPELLWVLSTGETWFQVSPTIRYEFEGALPPGVSAKDVFLYMAGRWGSHANLNLEFGGSALARLTLDARRTISTQAAELSADFAVWEADEILLEHVHANTRHPFEAVAPDPDATYVDVRTVDLAAMEPHVARPDTVIENTLPVRQLEDEIRLDTCFVGSCANGNLDDLVAVAEVLQGRRVAEDVRFIVTPGSVRIRRGAGRLGVIDTLLDAGAIVTYSACGACAGQEMGVLAPGEVCLTASTRNFRGRMGSPDARIWMASPATVAASAVAGRIVTAEDLD